MISLPKNIEYIITDFDGVLTDGYIYITENSDKCTKKLNFKDIMAISIAIKNGYKVGIISGEKGSIIDYVANKFNLEEVHQGIRTKIDVLKSILEKLGLDRRNVVYIGDDINDIDCLNYVGFPITVPNAIQKVKELNNIQITENKGGEGAFREIIEALVNE
jgi:YrbI family 3-deoxy-D-manno-octulosonate 8-phosphate phosphatase